MSIEGPVPWNCDDENDDDIVPSPLDRGILPVAIHPSHLHTHPSRTIKQPSYSYAATPTSTCTPSSVPPLSQSHVPASSSSSTSLSSFDAVCHAAKTLFPFPEDMSAFADPNAFHLDEGTIITRHGTSGTRRDMRRDDGRQMSIQYSNHPTALSS